MSGNAAPPLCPHCGGKLLWDGKSTSCLSCPYVSLEAKTDKKFPAVRSQKPHKKDGDSPRC